MWRAAVFLRTKSPLRPSTSHITQSCVRRLCSVSNQESIAQFNLRLAHDNTFLSYHRNAIIATVAGASLVQYRKDEARPPLAAASLLIMGGMYMYVGSFLYLRQLFSWRHVLHLTPLRLTWATFNASWPIVLWTTSLACIVDETPSWLLVGLQMVEKQLPPLLHKSLFVPTASLKPVLRLLTIVCDFEGDRLRVMHKINDDESLLTDDDYRQMIELRIERLMKMQSQLEQLSSANEDHIPSDHVVRLLDQLYGTIVHLEIAVDAEWTRLKETSTQVRWLWLINRTVLSQEQQLLLDELEAVRALKRRCMAIKFDSEEVSG